eukprot:jgi/Mesvir1/14568/Mv05249-RA.1
MIVLTCAWRLIIREVEEYAEPGDKYCCFYCACLCCCAKVNEVNHEREDVVQVAEIRDMSFRFDGHKRACNACACCLCCTKQTERARVKLHLVRPMGECKAGFGSWKLDKDLKTYHCTVEIEGRISREAAEEMHQALRRVVQSNVDAKLAVLAASVKDHPVKLNINLA